MQLIKVIKDVSQKQAETKKLIYFQNNVDLTPGFFATWNLMYAIGSAQGVTDNQFIGDEFFLKGIDLRGFVNNRASIVGNNATTADCSTRYEIGIIQCPKYATVAALPSADIFQPVVPSFTNQHMFDPKKVKFHKSKVIKIYPQISGIVIEKEYKTYIPINKKVSFRDRQNSYELKQWNYYLYVAHTCPKAKAGTSDVLTSGSVNFQITMYIKDQ